MRSSSQGLRTTLIQLGPPRCHHFEGENKKSTRQPWGWRKSVPRIRSSWMSATHISCCTWRVPILCCTFSFPRIGAFSPVAVFIQLCLTKSDLTIEILPPVSTVIQHWAPLNSGQSLWTCLHFLQFQQMILLLVGALPLCLWLDLWFPCSGIHCNVSKYFSIFWISPWSC